VYVLDTDHIGILQGASGVEFDALSARIAQRLQDEFFVSVVSFHEEILGWNAYIARAKNLSGVVRGYSRLTKILHDFSRAQVLPFDEAAAGIFENLRSKKVRVGAMDLRIAATALSLDMTVLPRNLVDFRRIPNLTVEDWTTHEPLS